MVKGLPKIIIQPRTKLKIAIFSKIQQSKALVLMERWIIRAFLIHYNPKRRADQLPTINSI